jgi:CHASE2 domain-containing sensor protein
MLISGILTITMFYGLFAPQAALESMFGASFNGALENIVVRSWSALVGLIGIIMIYGAISPTNRVFALSIAASSKVIFVALIVFYGQEFLEKAALAIILDCVVIVLSATYLFALLRQPKKLKQVTTAD